LSAARQRKYRERIKSGRGVWRVEADIVELEYLLESAKLLPVGIEHDHASVQAALTRFIETLIAEVTRNGTGNSIEI
jgi:hypothetical protein